MTAFLGFVCHLFFDFVSVEDGVVRRAAEMLHDTFSE